MNDYSNIVVVSNEYYPRLGRIIRDVHGNPASSRRTELVTARYETTCFFCRQNSIHSSQEASTGVRRVTDAKAFARI